jgi:hypothetical protein
MPNESSDQFPLRIERVYDVRKPNAKSHGTPRQVMYIEIGDRGADDFASLVIDRTVNQTDIEVHGVDPVSVQETPSLSHWSMVLQSSVERRAFLRRSCLLNQVFLMEAFFRHPWMA